ncbi:BMA-SDHD-1 [Dirofilaria immitis]|nr:BMA-SDHD-1 [Dirofilaria immitis]
MVNNSRLAQGGGGRSGCYRLVVWSCCMRKRTIYLSSPDATMHHWRNRKVLFGCHATTSAASYFIHGPSMDTALAIAITLHAHWGLHGLWSSICTGPTMAKIVQGPFTYIISICLLAGLLHFNSYDVGITKAFEIVWSL